ncbi:protein involved in gliding motility GldH [Pricia antarctica]|uniref:Protein involved in gliding motility GldH n=1 Tax=Pricia antarctica TaxID=641691 RepID=A0A1G6X0U7_9FLAO|nr:gliding motility lipoprotein GldH [Pricia antarctica]SDD70865.1 protein involved in gliding motility GldH [Pricia antarctica]
MRSALLILTISAVLFSCNTELVKSEFRATNGGAWNKDNTIEFNFSEIDTVQRHNMFINIRNDATFPYSNLFLIAELEFPTGETVKDTLQYEMALPDGTWLGKGFGSIKENKLWYKENIVFPTSGVYTIRISQAMRKNGSVNGVANLEGITDVGFEIDKSSE